MIEEGKKVSRTQIENTTGGAHYFATLPLSEVTVTNGSRGQIIIPYGNFIDLNTPNDFPDGMVASTSKLIGVNDKDIFITEIRITAKSSVANGRMAIELDIGGTLGVVRKQTINLHKSSNTEDEFAFCMKYYTGSTFIANGGTLYLRAIDGDITYRNIHVLPSRIHKGY